MLVREVDDPATLAEVATLVGLPELLLRDLASSGSLVAAAIEDDGTLAGATVAFLSTLGLHSWCTVGPALELRWFEREWALAAGLSTITWTFDPADVTCARLSVRDLGAEITSTLDDRVVATWALRSARVTGAWHGVAPDAGEADHRCRPGAELRRALDGGCHVVDVDEDGTWLLRGPG